MHRRIYRSAQAYIRTRVEVSKPHTGVEEPACYTGTVELIDK